MENKGDFLPERFRVLSGSVLKTVAVITMLADHTASVLLRNNGITLFSIGGHSMTLYIVLRLIGRMAFPIYAFLLVEGFLHTRSRKKYGINLLLFALISEIPWNLEHSGKLFLPLSQNVFFTLFIGFLGLCAIEKYKDNIHKEALWLILLGMMPVAFFCDYGAQGFAVIILFYLFRENRLYQTVSCAFLLSYSINTLGVLSGFGLINMYNGKRGFVRGPLLKYLFYIVYPAHMLALYFIKKRYLGY